MVRAIVSVFTRASKPYHSSGEHNEAIYIVSMPTAPITALKNKKKAVSIVSTLTASFFSDFDTVSTIYVHTDPFSGSSNSKLEAVSFVSALTASFSRYFVAISTIYVLMGLETANKPILLLTTLAVFRYPSYSSVLHGISTANCSLYLYLSCTAIYVACINNLFWLKHSVNPIVEQL